MRQDQKVARSSSEAGAAGVPSERAVAVFAHLCELLEQYGPAWYSEDLHDRANGALQMLQSSMR